ncbi:MAG: DUF4330 domain-containing protein [Peptoniphilus sp.]|nr:DUF4330 domain-containing protein [Peptoniphilus sp.]MDD7362574.1 DUF4330 domain-containing protein [Bacillota bacterium]MDY6045027.1 DUF4330 domain-containing protein [Peptoniphilus sp.]
MIDRKGRLFGKINIIDLIFLLILIVALVAGVSRYRNSSVSVENQTKGKMTLLVDNIREPSVENIIVGEDLYGKEKDVYFGKIVDKNVKPYEDATEYQGEWIKAPVPDKYSVYVDVDVDVTETDKAYMVGGQEVRVGTEYQLKSKSIGFTGVCVGISVDGE